MPSGARSQRLVEVGDDVVDVLRADRDANIIGRHAGGKLLRLAQLLVRRAGRMDHERLAVADIGQMAGELDAVDEPDRRPPGRL